MGRNLSLTLIFGFIMMASSLVFAAGCYASITALGRNPSAAPKIFTALVIGLVFAQALAIIVILVAFQLFKA